MTPEQRANELIQQSRESRADRWGTSPRAATAFRGDDSGEAAAAAEVRRLREAAVTDAGNIPQDVRIAIPPDPAASRVGGSRLLEQLRQAGAQVKTFTDEG